VALDGVPVNDLLQQAQSTQRRKKRSQRKPGKHVVIPGDGDPCPRCDQPMQIREHDGIGWRDHTIAEKNFICSTLQPLGCNTHRQQ
jgi:hypothetical protein